LTLVPRPRIGLPFLVHPIQQARAMSNHVFGDEKIYCTKFARPLGVKGLEPISRFPPIRSEDSWPLTEQIGLASTCKAALRTAHTICTNNLYWCTGSVHFRGRRFWSPMPIQLQIFLTNSKKVQKTWSNLG